MLEQPPAPLENVPEVNRLLEAWLSRTSAETALARLRVMAKFSSLESRVDWPGPVLGEHTDEVLGGLLGSPLSDPERLRKEGII